MSRVFVKLTDVSRKEPLQMAFVQHGYIIQQVAAAVANPAAPEVAQHSSNQSILGSKSRPGVLLL